MDRIAQAKELDLRSIIKLRDERAYYDYKAGYCPFHEAEGNHDTPSFLVYRNKYRCLSSNCGKTGDIFNWFAYTLFGDSELKLRGFQFKEVLNEILETSPQDYVPDKILLKQTDKEEINLLRLARAYHKNLIKCPNKYTYFLSRGFTPKTIVRQMWGWDGKNYVITVWKGVPRKSKLLSLRLRNSTDDGSRYSGITGYNDQLLYNREALLRAIKNEAPYIAVFYGEFDAQLAYQDGIYAVSPTNGAKSLLPEWFEGYNGNKVVIPDKGEENDAYSDAGNFGVSGWVAHLPSGSFKDYSEFRTRGGNADDIRRIIRQTIGII